MQEESKGNGALALTWVGDKTRVAAEREDADIALDGVELEMKSYRRIRSRSR